MSNLLAMLSSSLVGLTVLLTASQIKDPSDQLSKKPKRIAKPSEKQIWLSQARVNLSVNQYLLCMIVSTLFVFVFVSAFTKTPFLGIIFGLAAAWIPHLFISKRRMSLSRELVDSWPEALRDVSATISAGHNISFALSNLSRVGPDPIAIHMERFSTLEKTLGFVAALENVREEMNDATSDRIIEVLIVSHENGGRIVKEIIDDLIESTTEDISLADTIATESIEMKINSRAVVVLPWCVLALLTFSGSTFRDFYQSSAGAVVILIGAVLSVIGITILSKLSSQEIEPRVFNYAKVGKS